MIGLQTLSHFLVTMFLYDKGLAKKWVLREVIAKLGALVDLMHAMNMHIPPVHYFSRK